MANRAVEGMKRFILWEYERGSWQYDVIVALILAFIFLTPREFFRDQPRIGNPTQIVRDSAERGVDAYWMDSAVLGSVPEAEWGVKAASLIGARRGKRPTVLRVQAIRDQVEDEVKGYLVYARP